MILTDAPVPYSAVRWRKTAVPSKEIVGADIGRLASIVTDANASVSK